MNDQPDSTEKKLRFGCGALFGLFIAFTYSMHRIFVESDGLFIIFVIACILLFGFLAMKYGNRFWYTLRHFLHSDEY